MTSKGNKVIRFRATAEDLEVISQGVKKLGLGTDSAVIRVLMRLGLAQVDKFHNLADIVAHPLKISELGYFVSSLKHNLTEKKKAILETPRYEVGSIVATKNL